MKRYLFQTRAAYEWQFNHLPTTTRQCVPLAVARHLAKDPKDVFEVAELAGLVYQELVRAAGSRRMTPEGSYNDSVKTLEALLDLKVLEVQEPKKPKPHNLTEDTWARWGHNYCNRTEEFPTVAQWERANPDVTEALVRTTDHLGYYKDGIGYALSPRSRVDTVLVLNRKGS